MRLCENWMFKAAQEGTQDLERTYSWKFTTNLLTNIILTRNMGPNIRLQEDCERPDKR